MSQTRRLAAILAADVAGYSRLMGADEEGTLERLKALRRELLDPKIAEHHGRIVKTTGDGLLVEFASVVDAGRCAVAVQQAMTERNIAVAADDRIELRIGINLGDVIVEGDDLYGDGVNIAARIEALADAGGVFVSNTVHDHVRDRLPFVFENLGEQQVKNIARPVRVYRVRIGENARAKAALALPDKPSLAVPLKRKSMRWAIDNRDKVAAADPQIPQGLNDRAADNWRILLAVADVAGGHWGQTARSVAQLVAGGREDSSELIARLHDINVFLSRKKSIALAPAIFA
jgi:class 3 adenylate cyclase